MKSANKKLPKFPWTVIDWFIRRILIWHLSPMFFSLSYWLFFLFSVLLHCCRAKHCHLTSSVLHLVHRRKRTNLLWDCYTILWNNVIFCKIPLDQTHHTFRDFVVSFFLILWHALWHLSWTMQRFTLYQGHTVLAEPILCFLRSLCQQRLKFVTTVIIYMWGIFGGVSVVVDFQKWWNKVLSLHILDWSVNSPSYSCFSALRINAAFITRGLIKITSDFKWPL